MFKFCEIIGISKIKLFNFSVTEKGEENLKKLENHSKPQKLVRKSLSKKFLQKAKLFLFFSLKIKPFSTLKPAVRILTPTYCRAISQN